MSVNRDLESGDTVVVPRSDMIGVISVLGQVNKVGQLALRKNMTFREAMGAIGGVLVSADVDRVTVKREGLAEPLKIDYGKSMEGDPVADIVLSPGDTIFVPEMENAFFTVYGGVNRPGQYPMKGKMKLSEALGLAGGGTTGVGDLRKVRVTHAAPPGGNAPEPDTVDMTRVQNGQGKDPLVVRGDVIYVTEHKPQTNVLEVLRNLVPFVWLWR